MTASDDQTIRIWNWQSRSCVAQLTGHSHYVMCAQFHPREDLVVSCSLDQTIRVWDIAYLRRKGSMSPMDEGGPGSARGAGQIDLFASSDGQVKYVLEGHDRGVNWVAFHPSKPLIASGSDDRSVRLWRFNDSRAWETDCFRGHLNNVSCVAFHPTLDLVLSASEDRSLRVWDYGKRAGSGAAQTFRRETERYWMLAVHPTLGMFAAGHDGGLQLFKLERERPPQLVLDESLFFVRGAALLRRDVSRPEGTETALVTLGAPPVLPALLDYSPSDRAFLVSSGAEYDLVGRSSRHGIGACAHFLAGGGRFVVLDEGAQLLRIRSVVDGTEQAALSLPIPEVERAFKCPVEPDTVILASASHVVLWDLARKALLAELETPARIKRLSWSPDGTRCALLSRKGIILTDQSLTVIASVTEHVSVKSAVWEPVDFDQSSSPQLHMLFYTTPHHLKYMLPSGETGIVCTTENPLYLVRVSGGQVWALDRSAAVQTLSVDPAEWRFKLALLAGDLPRCLSIIAGSTSIVGQSVIGYLREHGYASLALRFVDDPQSCLELAMECADWDAAIKAAEALDRPEAWQQLALAAKRLGFPAIAQQACAQIPEQSQSDSLFLSTLTGRFPSQSPALPAAALQAAMLRGDATGLASALEDSGLSPLAFLARARGGLPQPHRPKEGAELEYPTGALTPCRPVNASDAAWPLSRPLFDYQVPPTLESMNTQKGSNEILSPVQGADGGWGQDALPVPQQDQSAAQFSDFVAAQENPLLQTRVPVLHLLAGSVESARSLLTQQAGIVDFDPLRPYMERIVKSAASLGALVDRFEDVVPQFTFQSLSAELNNGLALTTEGRFAEAIAAFESLLYQAPLAILQPGEDISPLISEAREYLVGLRMEISRKEVLAAHSGAEALPPAIATRILELACYFACCPLRPSHRALAARSAMTLAFRLRQVPLAGRMAKRLLDLQSETELDPAIAAQATKVMAAARSAPSDSGAASLPIQFDDHLDFDLDASTHTPLYAGQQTLSCPYCHAHYGPASKASVCSVCKMAAVDAPAQGLTLSL